MKEVIERMASTFGDITDADKPAGAGRTPPPLLSYPSFQHTRWAR